MVSKNFLGILCFFLEKCMRGMRIVNLFIGDFSGLM